MPKEITEHKDILGQPVHEGSYVAASRKNLMQVCQVRTLNTKMIRVVPIQYLNKDHGGYLVYSKETVVLSGPDALAYILQHAGA